MEKLIATGVLGIVALGSIAAICFIIDTSQDIANLDQMSTIAVTALANVASVSTGAIGGLITGEIISKRKQS